MANCVERCGEDVLTVPFQSRRTEFIDMNAKRASDVLPSEKYESADTADGPPTVPAVSLVPSSSQLQQTRQPVQKVLAMAEGDGEASYSKNSRLQAAMKQAPMLSLDEGLERMTLPYNGEAVVVADLGSSSGPNTISTISHIVDKLRPRLPKDIEFQAYFNDLPSNDFNNLFQLLSNDSRTKNLFSAGVPGSFFDRLFPQSSVHIFYSAFSVHWLSKIPDAVLDKDSPAYNKGNLWIRHSPSAVATAYRQQALLDLKNFLQARAAELVSGGLLFFVYCGRSSSEPNNPANTFFGKALAGFNEICSELIGEGLLTEHQRDTFNFPVYMRDTEDLQEAVASCDSLYHVLTAEQRRSELSALEVFATSDATDLSRKLTAAVQALVNILLEDHVGKKVTEVIWQRYEKKVSEFLGITIQNPTIVDTVSLVSLIRK